MKAAAVLRAAVESAAAAMAVGADCAEAGTAEVVRHRAGHPQVADAAVTAEADALPVAVAVANAQSIDF